MWTPRVDLPIPMILLYHDNGNVFNTGVSLEKFIDVCPVDNIEVHENTDHTCILSFKDVCVHTTVPFDGKKK